MKITDVQIENFRSVNSLHLSDLGQLNVFVGANNAGKSNILSAISLALTTLEYGLIDLYPQFGSNEVDYHKRRVDIPILTKFEFRKGGVSASATVKTSLFKYPIPSVPDDGLGVNLIAEAMQGVSYVSELRWNESIVLSIDEKTAELLAAVLSLIHLQNGLELIEQLGDDWIPKMRRYFSEGDNWLVYWQSLAQKIGLDSRNAVIVNITKTLLEQSQGDIRAFKDKSNEFKTFVKTSIAGLGKDLTPTFRFEKLCAVPADSNVKNRLQQIQDGNLLVLERINQLTEDGARSLSKLKNQRGQVAKFNRIRESVLKLSGATIDVLENSNDEMEIDLDGFESSVAGSGLQKTTSFQLALEHFKAGSKILIEEPENHLHADLQIRLLDYLEDLAEQQVFATTHSSNFIPNVELNRVFLVSKNTKRETTVQRIEPGSQTEILKVLGLDFKALFLAKVFVFVEGTSDEAFIRQIAQNLKLDIDSASFIKLGGSGNLHYYAVNDTLEILRERGAKLFLVVDSDEKDSSTVEKVKKSLSGQLEVMILERREIENYLLVAEAIQRTFLELNGNNKTKQLPSIEQIIQAIDEGADEYKALTINKRALTKFTDLLPKMRREDFKFDGTSADFKVSIEKLVNRYADNKAEILAACDQAILDSHKEVEADWSTRKLEFVPGAEILEFTFRKFGFKFNKTRDVKKIASHMKRDTIDPALVQIIKSIEHELRSAR